MGHMIVETHGLTKTYRRKNALDRVSINIERGGIYGLVGQNGAGKSTLLRLLTGLALPTAGSLALFGVSDGTGLTRARRRIGSLIERPALCPDMSARNNLRLVQTAKGLADRYAVDGTLELLGLADTGNKAAGRFSTGMQQRLAIAAALLGWPELLILDEPLNALDPVGIVEIRALLARICRERGTTILLSSHILPDLHQLATDYLFIHQGRIIQTITAPDLDAACKRHLLIGTDDPALAATVLETDLGTDAFQVMPDGKIKLYSHLDRMEEVSAVLTAHGLTIGWMALDGDTLESYYLSLIGGGERGV